MGKFKRLLVVCLLLLPITIITFSPVSTQTTIVAKAKKAKTTKPKHHYLLVMGHGAGDPGAHGNGQTEANVLRKKFLPALKKYAKRVKHSRVTFYNPKHDIVKDTLTYHRGSYKISKNTTVIMFHMDASGASATGGHVIIHRPTPTKRDRRLAKVIKRYVGLNRAYNGFSYRTDLHNCNVLRRRGIDYSLIETGFITNRHDYHQVTKHINGLSKGYIEAITNEKIK